jgi:hypothetical protein
MAAKARHHADPMSARGVDLEAEVHRASSELRGSVAEDSLPEMAFRLAAARLREKVVAQDDYVPLVRPPTYLWHGDTAVESVLEPQRLGVRGQPPGAAGRASQPIVTCEVQLPIDSTAPGAARRWVASHLAPTGLFPEGSHVRGKLFDVLICTSELVNASLIANSTTMSMTLRVRDQTVRVSLRDDRIHPTEPQDLRMHAQLFVLGIFDTMTDAWGINPAPHGRMLWFELNVN